MEEVNAVDVICDLSKQVAQLRTENEELKADVKRGAKAWKAIYCELEAKFKRMTEAWQADVRAKTDSVFAGTVHYEIPAKALKGKEADSGKEVQ